MVIGAAEDSRCARWRRSHVRGTKPMAIAVGGCACLHILRMMESRGSNVAAQMELGLQRLVEGIDQVAAYAAT